MVRFILLLALAVVIARTFWRFFDAIVRAAGGTSTRGPQGGGKPVSVKMQQCPVCGTYVVPGKAITVVSGGNPIYFDSEKCRTEYQSR